MAEQQKPSKKSIKQSLEDNAPWKTPPYELSDAAAIQALSQGKADKSQQERALKWIVEVASGVFQPSYRADNDRDTVFAEGRRYVGLHILHFLKLNLSQLRRKNV